MEAAPAIALDELQASAALRTRLDRKYVVEWEQLTALLGALSDTHRVLEIAGHRVFRYESVYFDSPDLLAFRAHLQRRRRRYKVRSRHYVDTGLRTFEVKLKGKRGETVKHQMPYGDEDLDRVSEHAQRFLAERLGEAYPRIDLPQLSPTLRNGYQRFTLTAGIERLTCDFDLSYGHADIDVPGLDPRYVIVESKCEKGLGAADRELRRLGVRPVGCSKYCVGVGLLRADAKVNELRWLLNRYFAGNDRRAEHPPALPTTPNA
ncbi:MAG: polyphosphate polymerase domain-containing protein [Actinomycetota bacterium]|nr:polyphosphate polymerase domain-containing protein [Actinomycetota bacterium]